MNSECKPREFIRIPLALAGVMMLATFVTGINGIQWGSNEGYSFNRTPDIIIRTSALGVAILCFAWLFGISRRTRLAIHVRFYALVATIAAVSIECCFEFHDAPDWPIRWWVLMCLVGWTFLGCWTITRCWIQMNHWLGEAAPTGCNKTAQGNALGNQINK